MLQKVYTITGKYWENTDNEAGEYVGTFYSLSPSDSTAIADCISEWHRTLRDSFNHNYQDTEITEVLKREDYDDAQNELMKTLHGQAEAYSQEHETPSVREELDWAGTQLMLGKMEVAAWEGAVQVYDSCTVEPDGVCPHGYKSPLILLGLI